MKINQALILKLSTVILTLFVSFSFCNLTSAAVIWQQLDKSTSVDVTYSSGYGGQSVGTVSATTTLGSITISLRSTYTGTSSPASMVFQRCTDSSCTGYDQSWSPFTTSARDTYINYPTVTNSQNDYNFDFTYAQRRDGFAGSGTPSNSTGVLLTPGRYYRFFPGKTYNKNGTTYGCLNDCYPNGVYMGGSTTLGDQYFIAYDMQGQVPLPPADGRSQIIYYYPANSTTTLSTAVNFGYKVYINGDDIGFWSSKKMLFTYKHQPLGDEIPLVNQDATSSGYYTFSTTTTLATGNYLISACIYTTYLGGIVKGLFPDCENDQFVVMQGTFIGNLLQDGLTSVQNQLDNLTATSSIATLGAYCNPFSGFDIVQCFYALLIPTSSQMKDTMQTFYSDFLTRIPWGYGSVAIADLLGYNKTATTSLAASNLTIVLPNTGVFATATSTSMMKGKSMTFIDWNQIASSTTQNYWAPALTPLNNFLNIMMGGAFMFWLYHFFKKMRP